MSKIPFSTGSENSQLWIQTGVHMNYKSAEVQLKEEEDFIDHCNGLYVGLLSAEELIVFERLRERGIARRMYSSGIAQLFGLAKVEIVLESLGDENEQDSSA